MKYCLFIITILVFSLISCSHKNVKTNIGSQNHSQHLTDSLSIDDYTFPKDWLGYWSGELKIYDSNGLKQKVSMSLDLAKTDNLGIYTWAIMYGSDSTAQRREYELKEIDPSKGHYLIDEKNGILLDAYHIHNELISVFEVMGNSLITSYAIKNQELIFSVKMFPSKEIRVSGDTIILNQEIPKVNSYQMKISQVARLQKKCLVE